MPDADTLSISESPLHVLAETHCFRNLDTAVLGALIEAANTREIGAGEALFRAGDAYGQVVYILLSGNVVMRRLDGTEADILIGDFLGLANYLDNAPYAAAAIATTHAAVLEITAQRLRELEQDYPPLFNLLNRIIAQKLRDRRPDRGISSGTLAQPVVNVMRSPVTSCGPELSLREAFNLMDERRIGSLVVTDADGKLLGMMSYARLSQAVLLNGARPDDRIIQSGCQIARTVQPETPLWKADEIQQRFAVKYLVVVDGGKPLGVLSQSDILRALISQPSTLTTQIPEADSIKELALLNGRIPKIAAELRESNRQPSAAVRYLSETHLAIQRRTVELTLEWMEKKGHGPAPVDFAVLIMGSGGRKEMLLNPDQDNGIILQDGPKSDKAEVRDWFERFAHRMNKNLDRVGYILCPGDIMARNPMYHKTLSQWKKQISHITKHPTEKAARWSNVVFDFDTLYGNDTLTLELRQHVLSRLKRRPRVLRMMAKDDAEGRPALGFFNQLITTIRTEEGQHIDLKRNGLRLVADAARIFALHNGIAVQNTMDRLNALVRLGKLSDDFSASLSDAFDQLLDLLLTHEIRQAKQGKALNKLIDPNQLTTQARSALQTTMRAVKRLQELLQDEFETEIF